MIMEKNQIEVYNSKDFRNWLMKNHLNKNRVILILYKRHTGKPAPSHRELIEEAICFGWIDTTVKKLNDNMYLRNFVKRTKNSRWSLNTLSYAKQLIKENRMSPEGLRVYKEGLKKLPHDYGVSKNPEMIPDFKLELSRNKILEKFEELPPSKKKVILRWIIRARLPETRKKRIKKMISLILEGKSDIY